MPVLLLGQCPDQHCRLCVHSRVRTTRGRVLVQRGLAPPAVLPAGRVKHGKLNLDQVLKEHFGLLEWPAPSTPACGGGSRTAHPGRVHVMAHFYLFLTNIQCKFVAYVSIVQFQTKTNVIILHHPASGAPQSRHHSASQELFLEAAYGHSCSLKLPAGSKISSGQNTSRDRQMTSKLWLISTGNCQSNKKFKSLQIYIDTDQFQLIGT